MTGIRQRHGNRCNGGKACGCPWRAEVFSVRDRTKIRKTFRSKAAAAAWRTDRLAAAQKGALRAPTSKTVREAAEAFMDGARDGSIPTSSGARYKPATLRGYRVGLDKRVLQSQIWL